MYKFLFAITSFSSKGIPAGDFSSKLSSKVSSSFSKTLGIIVNEENWGFILYKVLSLLLTSDSKLFIFDCILAFP